MNTPVSPSGATPRRGLHPLVATAAVAVIVLCTVAVASLVGWLPTPWAESSGPAPVHEAQAQAEQAAGEPPAPPQPAASQPPAPQPAPAKTASAPKAAPAPKAPAKPATCADCGVVETIRPIQVPAQNPGYNVVGTVAGGVVGGVVGHQFGGGSGKDALTVLGAVGGALAGHEIERNIRQQQTVTHYELIVRMDNGSTHTFRSAQPFAYASGDHVRVENGQLLPR